MLTELPCVASSAVHKVLFASATHRHAQHQTYGQLLCEHSCAAHTAYFCQPYDRDISKQPKRYVGGWGGACGTAAAAEGTAPQATGSAWCTRAPAQPAQTLGGGAHRTSHCANPNRMALVEEAPVEKEVDTCQDSESVLNIAFQAPEHD